MPLPIKDVMTACVHAVVRDASLREVAYMMRDHDIGLVVVNHADGSLYGVVTDRDLVTRGIASPRDIDAMRVGDVCSCAVVTLPPTATLEDALKVMRERAVRRIPIVAEGRAIGVVSLCDLARSKDPHSTLAQISWAAPSH